MDKSVTIGVHIAQEHMDFSGIRKVCKAAEDLGFDSVTLMDHFRPYYPPKTGNLMECWTTLGALAMETKRIKIGALVTCASYRNPAVLAKIASCVDHMSKGRLKFGIGAGWFQEEAQEYGIHFGSPKERIERLREAVQVIKKLWVQDEASFRGKYYQINRAVCNPKPLQKPHPPIIIGGHREKMLKLIAELADGWNAAGSLERWKKGFNTLKRYCEEIGRDWKQIELSWSAWVILSSDRSKIAEFQPSYIKNLDDFIDAYLIGTPDTCIKKMQCFIDLGVSDFELVFPDTFYSSRGEYPKTPSLQTMKKFAEAILPHFRTST